MPSTTTQTKSPNFGRRIKWLGLTTGVIFVLYSVGWFYLAQAGKRRADDALANIAQTGTLVSCEESEIKGFPFRFGIFCNSTSFEQPQKGIAFFAGALRSAAQVYDPKHVIIELDSPARLDAPGLEPLNLNWSLLHASARLAEPLPRRVSLEAEALQIAMRGPAGADTNLVQAAYASVHMRTEDKDIALAGEGDGIIIDPAATPSRKVPVFSASYDLLVLDGVAALVSKPKSLRGLKSTLRQSQIIFKDGGTIKLSGPVSIDASGLIDAELTIAITDPKKLGTALAQITPEAANVTTTMMTTMAAANGDGNEAKIDVKIRKGKVSTGFFPLGQIPPIQ